MFTAPESLQNLIAKVSTRKFRLKLLCDKCQTPCEPGYIIEKSPQTLVELLPVLQVSLKVNM